MDGRFRADWIGGIEGMGQADRGDRRQDRRDYEI